MNDVNITSKKKNLKEVLRFAFTLLLLETIFLCLILSIASCISTTHCATLSSYSVTYDTICSYDPDYYTYVIYIPREDGDEYNQSDINTFPYGYDFFTHTKMFVDTEYEWIQLEYSYMYDSTREGTSQWVESMWYLANNYYEEYDKPIKVRVEYFLTLDLGKIETDAYNSGYDYAIISNKLNNRNDVIFGDTHPVQAFAIDLLKVQIAPNFSIGDLALICVAIGFCGFLLKVGTH